MIHTANGFSVRGYFPAGGECFADSRGVSVDESIGDVVSALGCGRGVEDFGPTNAVGDVDFHIRLLGAWFDVSKALVVAGSIEVVVCGGWVVCKGDDVEGIVFDILNKIGMDERSEVGLG